MVIFHSYVSLPEGNFCTCICLVVDLPLWTMMEFVSWEDDIPNIWRNKNKSNHQPVHICIIHYNSISVRISIYLRSSYHYSLSPSFHRHDFILRIIWLGDSKKLLKLIPFTADSLMGIHSFNRNECWIWYPYKWYNIYIYMQVSILDWDFPFFKPTILGYHGNLHTHRIHECYIW